MADSQRRCRGGKDVCIHAHIQAGALRVTANLGLRTTRRRCISVKALEDETDET